jgi:nanoRNase/pAp phosphatase (c-di-AMP/oligoRNAs hydrolase)
MRVWQHALENIKYHYDDQVCGCLLSREWLNKLNIPESEISGCFKWFISEILINIAGVKVAYLLYPLESWENKISTRSQEWYNVAEICESFWGGWHKQAAGFESHDTAEKIEKELLEKIKATL